MQTIIALSSLTRNLAESYWREQDHQNQILRSLSIHSQIQNGVWECCSQRWCSGQCQSSQAWEHKSVEGHLTLLGAALSIYPRARGRWLLEAGSNRHRSATLHLAVRLVAQSRAKANPVPAGNFRGKPCCWWKQIRTSGLAWKPNFFFFFLAYTPVVHLRGISMKVGVFSYTRAHNANDV